MATIIRERVVERPRENANYGLLSFIIVLVTLYLLIVYGLPVIRNSIRPATQVNIPNRIDINLHQQPADKQP